MPQVTRVYCTRAGILWMKTNGHKNSPFVVGVSLCLLLLVVKQPDTSTTSFLVEPRPGTDARALWNLLSYFRVLNSNNIYCECKSIQMADKIDRYLYGEIYIGAPICGFDSNGVWFCQVKLCWKIILEMCVVNWLRSVFSVLCRIGCCASNWSA